MRPFIVPTILWSYVLSVVLAQSFWSGVFDRLVVWLDLSSNQAWVLPLSFNSLAAFVGFPQIISFCAALRRKEAIPISRHIGSSLSIAGASVCLAGAALVVFNVRHQLTRGIGELFGGEEADVFKAGQIVDGCYSNTVVGVAIELPKHWHVLSLNAVRRAKHSGTTAMYGEEAQRVEETATARRGDYTLLTVRRYPDAFTGYNPSLVLSAQEKQAFAATGIRSLDAYARSFVNIGELYHFRSGPSRERFGTENGYHVHIEGRVSGTVVQQHVYLAETDTLYIILVASVMDEADLSPMQHAITTLRLTKRRPR